MRGTEDRDLKKLDVIHALTQDIASICGIVSCN